MLEFIIMNSPLWVVLLSIVDIYYYKLYSISNVHKIKAPSIIYVDDLYINFGISLCWLVLWFESITSVNFLAVEVLLYLMQLLILLSVMIKARAFKFLMCLSVHIRLLACVDNLIKYWSVSYV